MKYKTSHTILDQIFEYKIAELEKRKKLNSLENLKNSIENVHKYSFKNAINQKNISLIAEIKKASPSEGIIKEDFDVAEIASVYTKSGADAMSILTDEKFFGGNLENLKIARQVSDLPLLRKDFLFDEYQIYESAVFGADAILLIAAMLEQSKLKDLFHLARKLGLDVLVETHTEEEIEIAQNIGAEIIGINSRNLHNFKTDLGTFKNLAKYVDKDCVLVAESGINSKEEVDFVSFCGADAVLIGTTFMKAKDIGEKVNELMGKA